MKCPVCLRNHSVSTQLPGGLTALACQVCQGHWIRRKSYECWLKLRALQASRDLEPAPVAERRKPRTTQRPMPRFCPDCRTFLMKYPVGLGFGFEIDTCGSCGGFWLDGGEWQALTDHGLHDELHQISSPNWQRSLREETRRANHSRRLEAALGPDVERVREFRRWLDTHPKADLIRQFLIAEGGGGGGVSDAPATPRVLRDAVERTQGAFA